MAFPLFVLFFFPPSSSSFQFLTFISCRYKIKSIIFLGIRTHGRHRHRSNSKRCSSHYGFRTYVQWYYFVVWRLFRWDCECDQVSTYCTMCTVTTTILIFWNNFFSFFLPYLFSLPHSLWLFFSWHFGDVFLSVYRSQESTVVQELSAHTYGRVLTAFTKKGQLCSVGEEDGAILLYDVVV